MAPLHSIRRRLAIPATLAVTLLGAGTAAIVACSDDSSSKHPDAQTVGQDPAQIADGGIDSPNLDGPAIDGSVIDGQLADAEIDAPVPIDAAPDAAIDAPPPLDAPPDAMT